MPCTESLINLTITTEIPSNLDSTGPRPRSIPRVFSRGQAMSIGACARLRAPATSTRARSSQNLQSTSGVLARVVSSLALTWLRCEALCRCRHVTPDGARRLRGSARLSARVEFAGCLAVRAFAQRTGGRDPSVTRPRTPSQRRPAPEPGFAPQTRQRERFCAAGKSGFRLRAARYVGQGSRVLP